LPAAKAYCLTANHYNIINTSAYAKEVPSCEFDAPRVAFVAVATTSSDI
jgi:hypothetical protein